MTNKNISNDTDIKVVICKINFQNVKCVCGIDIYGSSLKRENNNNKTIFYNLCILLNTYTYLNVVWTVYELT